MNSSGQAVDGAAKTCLAFIQKLFGGFRPRNFQIKFWDGSCWESEPGQTVRFTLTFAYPGAVREMFLRPSTLSLGEAFVKGAFDIEGDFEAACAMADYLFSLKPSLLDRFHLLKYFLLLPKSGSSAGHLGGAVLGGSTKSRARLKRAINYHYDLPLAFWQPWLDRQLVYSCAFFTSHDQSLDTAQEQKLEYICRKLDLRTGERFFDLGCGWGALILHAARRYGVNALGVTLSPRQAGYVEERIQAAGLQSRCRAEVCDYRDINDPGAFDKIASIGSIEHVREGRLTEYFQTIWKLLRPGGRFLIQGITHCPAFPRPRKPSFFDLYVFPDGHLAPLGPTLQQAEAVGFEVRDVESLREHYALTLRHWRRRLNAERPVLEQVAGPETFRIFTLYLAAAAHEFDTGRNNLRQVLFVKPHSGRAELPFTRFGWYLNGDR